MRLAWLIFRPPGHIRSNFIGPAASTEVAPAPALAVLPPLVGAPFPVVAVGQRLPGRVVFWHMNHTFGNSVNKVISASQ